MVGRHRALRSHDDRLRGPPGARRRGAGDPQGIRLHQRAVRADHARVPALLRSRAAAAWPRDRPARQQARPVAGRAVGSVAERCCASVVGSAFLPHVRFSHHRAANFPAAFQGDLRWFPRAERSFAADSSCLHRHRRVVAPRDRVPTVSSIAACARLFADPRPAGASSFPSLWASSVCCLGTPFPSAEPIRASMPPAHAVLSRPVLRKRIASPRTRFPARSPLFPQPALVSLPCRLGTSLARFTGDCASISCLLDPYYLMTSRLRPRAIAGAAFHSLCGCGACSR